MSIQLHLEVKPINKNHITVATIYKRPGLERHLPFQFGGVTLTNATGTTRVGQTPKGLVICVRSNACPVDSWHAATVAFVPDALDATRRIRAAVKALRSAVGTPRRTAMA